MTDNEYINAIRCNNQQTINKLYSHFRSSTIRFLRQRTSLSSDDICDIYQEALIILINKANDSNFTLSCSLATFINAISANVANNKMRQNSKTISADTTQPLLISVADDASNQEEQIEQNEQFSTLRHIVSSMGEPCLSLLKAFYWEQLSFAEIAQKLPNYSTADSARNNKSRCIGKLKEYYKKLSL